MREILVRVNGIGTNPADIARRKITIVDLAKSNAALSSNVTSLSFNSITVHIWFDDNSKAEAFVTACENYKPLITIDQAKAYR